MNGRFVVLDNYAGAASEFTDSAREGDVDLFMSRIPIFPTSRTPN
jgi:hypothetical protein